MAVRLNFIKFAPSSVAEGGIRGASGFVVAASMTKAIKELEENSARRCRRRSRGGVNSIIAKFLSTCQPDRPEGCGRRMNCCDARRNRRAINISLGASVARSLMPSVICRAKIGWHPRMKCGAEGQLLAMNRAARSWISPLIPITPGPYDHEFSFEKLFEKPFAVFARAKPSGGAGHLAMGS